MKFLYRYQRGDGAVCEDEIDAATQADAYSVLRKGGIRPMKVWPKPGFANLVLRYRRRAAVALMAVAAVLAACLAFQQHGIVVRQERRLADALSRRPCPRCEVDFAYEAERQLVAFARPGDIGESPDLQKFLSDCAESLVHPIRISEGDDPSAVILKRIVIGLKNEVRSLISAGESPESVFRRFVERQKMEHEYRSSLMRQVSQGRLAAARANEMLQVMGLPPLDEKFSKNTPLQSQRSL